MGPRTALSREAIVAAAVAVADRGGIAAVSMRTVGRELGVEAMSLYHHVRNKDALLDALADWVFALVELPLADRPWREQLERRSASARAVLGAHTWGLGLIESRSAPGPAVLRQHDAVLGCLRANGFPVRLAAHTFSVIDAYVYGFVLTEASLPFAPGEGAVEFVEQLEMPLDEYPHLVELMGEVVMGGEYDFADEFEVGLGMILDQVEVRLAASAR